MAGIVQRHLVRQPRAHRLRARQHMWSFDLRHGVRFGEMSLLEAAACRRVAVAVPVVAPGPHGGARSCRRHSLRWPASSRPPARPLPLAFVESSNPAPKPWLLPRLGFVIAPCRYPPDCGSDCLNGSLERRKGVVLAGLRKVHGERRHGPCCEI